jgi:Mg-chelatase subunit ChlD
MQTTESRKDRWVSGSLIAGAMLAGLAVLAAHGKGAAARAIVPPAPVAPAAPHAETPPSRPPAVQPPAPRPRVDIVFALDTTGSMSGLLEGAKRKIWSIASFVAHAQPSPDLRVGLVAYRDIGDAYVTRDYDLDADLDRVYRRVLSFRADGGGDAPEHVARALTEAVHRMSWSPHKDANDKAVRLIYLVGDAPPHVDYNDGYDYAKAARDAAQMGIQVHAIRCGADPETATYWRRIASLGHGEFLTIDQDGGMHDRHTPYDEELARLHDELSDTVVPFGAGAAEARAARDTAAAAPEPVKAARADYFAEKKEFHGDLVEEVARGKVDLDRIAPSELPASIAALPEGARKDAIAEKSKARSGLLGQISKLSGEREAYLHSHAGASGFDDEVEKTVRKAGASVGMKF